jgi:hypothetical protein
LSVFSYHGSPLTKRINKKHNFSSRRDSLFPLSHPPHLILHLVVLGFYPEFVRFKLECGGEAGRLLGAIASLGASMNSIFSFACSVTTSKNR